MSLADSLASIASNMQQGAKLASITFSQRLLRVITGLFLGAVISLIVQEFTGYGTLMFFFIFFMITALTYRSLRTLTLFQVFVFDVICILAAISLRMYIMIAPNLT